MMNPIEVLWNLIVTKAAEAQVLNGENRGMVRNEVIKDYYHRETAFAAKIFATEWLRTRNEEYLQRSEIALSAIEAYLDKHPVENGIDEPTLTPRGLRYRKGSIPATILLMYAAKEASNLLQREFKCDMHRLESYIASCHVGKGKYYHDAIPKDHTKCLPHVVNTSAMAYLYYSRLKNNLSASDQSSHQSEIAKSIINSQRSDGFWPYVQPGVLQKLFFKIDRIVPDKVKAIYNRLLLDYSIYFGDGVHHCITLYYLLLGAYSNEKNPPDYLRTSIMSGWRFIRKNLIQYDSNHIRFNFNWEPRPRHFRHCNFIDTSTYFYIFDIIHAMTQHALINSDEASSLTEGMARHIINSLVLSDNTIDGYEGSDSVKDLILPRPSESVFDKGFFMSNVILDKDTASL